MSKLKKKVLKAGKLGVLLIVMHMHCYTWMSMLFTNIVLTYSSSICKMFLLSWQVTKALDVQNILHLQFLLKWSDLCKKQFYPGLYIYIYPEINQPIPELSSLLLQTPVLCKSRSQHDGNCKVQHVGHPLRIFCLNASISIQMSFAEKNWHHPSRHQNKH